MGKFSDLNWRQLINNVSDMDTLKELIKEGSSFYIGVDPTADSLHLGHFLAYVVTKHFYDLGLKPVFVIGGFTAMIGDPSGKNKERPMVDSRQIIKNKKTIKKFISYLAERLDIPKEEYKIIDNSQIYSGINLVEFFQKYGKLFNLNTMLSRESVRKRIDSGISYTEFSYQVFQAIDFLFLYQVEKVKIQIGGSDQWGNMISGLELIRKVDGANKNVAVATFNLITDDKGEKIGKTQGNPVWLDKNKFSSYNLYQYVYNFTDPEALRFLAQLTFISREEFRELKKKASENPKERLVQLELARRLITMLHSEKDFLKAKKMAEKLYKGNMSGYIDLSQIPTIKYNPEWKLAFHLINDGHVKSMREYREFVAQGAIRVDGERISDEFMDVPKFKERLIIGIGKKRQVALIK